MTLIDIAVVCDTIEFTKYCPHLNCLHPEEREVLGSSKGDESCQVPHVWVVDKMIEYSARLINDSVKFVVNFILQSNRSIRIR